MGKINLSCNDLNILNQSVLQCKKCEELVLSRNTIVKGYGDVNAKILFIGEAPGRLGADITGIPFTKDRSGVLFQTILGKLGFCLSEPFSEFPILTGVYITNVIKCNPRNGKINRAPLKKEIDNCKQYLENEIRIIKPLMIVPLGSVASKTIIGPDFDSNDFGKLIVKDKKNFFLFGILLTL